MKVLVAHSTPDRHKKLAKITSKITFDAILLFGDAPTTVQALSTRDMAPSQMIKSIVVACNSDSKDADILLDEVMGLMHPRARYHFVLGELFHETLPFVNGNVVSRLVTLGADRWYFALDLAPLDRSVPMVIPARCGLNPYEQKMKQELAFEQQNQYFFEPVTQKRKRIDASEPSSDLFCRACGDRGHVAKNCPDGANPHLAKLKKRDPNQCWFCLSNPEVESHLIVSIVNETYVTLAKGGLVQDHLILVPVGHVSNSRAVEIENSPIQDEITSVIAKIDQMERTRDSFLVCFEVFAGPGPRNANRLQHLHIQLVPLPIELEEEVYPAFINFAKSGLEQRIGLPESPNVPFLRVHIVGRDPLVFTLREGRRGMQLAAPRIVLANLIGKPKRSDWKYCVVSVEDETSQTESLRERLSF